jgi:hypothetical protein
LKEKILSGAEPKVLKYSVVAFQHMAIMYTINNNRFIPVTTVWAMDRFKARPAALISWLLMGGKETTLQWRVGVTAKARASSWEER